MKKICFFNSSKNWGGGEKWHFETAKILWEKGYEIIVLGNINSELIKRCREVGIEVKEIKISNKSFLNLLLLSRHCLQILDPLV